MKTDITVLSDEMYEKNFTDLFKDSWLVDAFNTQDVFKLKCNNYKYELIFLSSTILLPFLIDFIPGLVITIIILAFVCEK